MIIHYWIYPPCIPQTTTMYGCINQNAYFEAPHYSRYKIVNSYHIFYHCEVFSCNACLSGVHRGLHIIN